MTDKKVGFEDDLLMPMRPFLFNVPVPPKLYEVVNAVIGGSKTSNLKIYVIVEKDEVKTKLFFNRVSIIDHNMSRVFFVRNEAESWKKTMSLLYPQKKLIILDAKFHELYPYLLDALFLEGQDDNKIVLSMEYEKDILDIETWTKETFSQIN